MAALTCSEGRNWASLLSRNATTSFRGLWNTTCATSFMSGNLTSKNALGDWRLPDAITSAASPAASPIFPFFLSSSEPSLHKIPDSAGRLRTGIFALVREIRAGDSAAGCRREKRELVRSGTGANDSTASGYTHSVEYSRASEREMFPKRIAQTEWIRVARDEDPSRVETLSRMCPCTGVGASGSNCTDFVT
eukprot:1472771-Rhodomonas_salina.2